MVLHFIQRTVTFFTIAVKYTSENYQTFVLVLPCYFLIIHRAQTLWNTSRSSIVPWAELCLLCSLTQHSYSHLSTVRNHVRTHSMFSSVVNLHRCPHQWNFCVIFYNMVIHSCTLSCGKEVHSYSAESLRWISVPSAPLVHKTRITALSSSLMHVEMVAALFSLLLRWYNWTGQRRNVITVT